MLSGIEARGAAAARTAVERMRRRVAQALGDRLPGVSVSIAGEDIVLAGRIARDDPRLRWIAGLLR